jgi:hypothetical protein
MHVGWGAGKSVSREVRGAGRGRKAESLFRDDAEKELLSVGFTIRPYRKPTQVGEESILRCSSELWLRN